MTPFFIESSSTRFSHVYWLGGSPCSGKSTTAAALADRFGLRYYNCDDAFFRHARQVKAEMQPVFTRIVQYSCEELWLRPVSSMLVDEIAIYQEEFPLILDDLRSLPGDAPILAEGAALMPELVAPLLSSPERGFWMVPAPAFQWEQYQRREWAWGVLKDCSDPARGFQNWMERDIRFAAEVQRQAERLGLPVHIVDGSLPIEETINLVGLAFRLVG